MMKAESSPCEVGPVLISDAVSGDVHAEDNFSDEEHETEFEALQHLPPDERRKALRRLRNRESARRVRARRLAEMSQMDVNMRNVKEENSTLKAHVNKLQCHIQSMTMKVYEITAKYESAVAENAQLRTELQRLRRPSVPGGSNYDTPAAGAGAPGPNSAPVQLSPFVSPFGAGAGLGVEPSADTNPHHPQQQLLSTGHAQLRNCSAVDLQQQRQALEEVVLLLKEHKRRSQMVGQDRSVGSEIGSSGVANNAAATATAALNNAHSPASDNGVAGAMPMYAGTGVGGKGGGAGATGVTPPGNMTESLLSYNGSGTGSAMGPSCGNGIGGGIAGRGGQCDAALGLRLQQQQQQQLLLQQQRQQQLLLQSQSAGGAAAASLCHAGLSSCMDAARLPTLCQQQQQQQQRFMQDQSVSASTLALQGMAGESPQHQQHQQLQQQQLQQAQQQAPQSLSQPLTRMQLPQQGPAVHSHSYPLPQLHLPQQQTQVQPCALPRESFPGPQEQWLGPGELQGPLYTPMSSLSAPFYSVNSTAPAGPGNAPHLTSHASGPCALGAQAQCGGGGGTTGFGREVGGQGGLGPGVNGSNHRSASFALDYRSLNAVNGHQNGASYQNVVSMHPGACWQPASCQAGGAVGAGAAGNLLGAMRPEDIPEDILMSLDDYVPQDL